MSDELTDRVSAAMTEAVRRGVFDSHAGLETYTARWDWMREILAERRRLEQEVDHIRHFYGERIDALQQLQKEMPEPWRTRVCDILANGRAVNPRKPDTASAL